MATPSALAVSAGGRRSHRYRRQHTADAVAAKREPVNERSMESGIFSSTAVFIPTLHHTRNSFPFSVPVSRGNRGICSRPIDQVDDYLRRVRLSGGDELNKIYSDAYQAYLAANK